MDLIVAVDLDWGIGKNNDLLFHVPEDMWFFRQMTAGQTVVLGRKTLESFPGGKPLKNRRHIVLTRNELNAEGNLEVCHSLYELEQKLVQVKGQVFLIGGSSLYKQLYRQCENAYVTRIIARAQADVFFPDLDEDPFFELVEEGEILTSQTGLSYQFLRYENKRIKHK